MRAILVEPEFACPLFLILTITKTLPITVHSVKNLLSETHLIIAVRDQCYRPLLQADVACRCYRPMLHAVVTGRCYRPMLYAVVTGRCYMLLLHAVVTDR